MSERAGCSDASLLPELPLVVTGRYTGHMDVCYANQMAPDAMLRCSGSKASREQYAQGREDKKILAGSKKKCCPEPSSANTSHSYLSTHLQELQSHMSRNVSTHKQSPSVFLHERRDRERHWPSRCAAIASHHHGNHMIRTPCFLQVMV